MSYVPPTDLEAAQNERDFIRARLNMLASISPEERQRWWDVMSDLIARRSPEQLDRIAREQHLG